MPGRSSALEHLARALTHDLHEALARELLERGARAPVLLAGVADGPTPERVERLARHVLGPRHRLDGEPRAVAEHAGRGRAPRAEREHVHAAGLPLPPERLRERQVEGLARRVARDPPRALEAGARRGEDEPTPAAPAQAFPEHVCRGEGAAAARVERRLVALEPLVEERADERQHRRVDDQADLRLDRREPLRDVGRREVDAEPARLDSRCVRRDPVQRLREQILADVDQQHVHAAPRDLVSEGEPDALPGAEHGGPGPIALGEGAHARSSRSIVSSSSASSAVRGRGSSSMWIAESPTSAATAYWWRATRLRRGRPESAKSRSKTRSNARNIACCQCGGTSWSSPLPWWSRISKVEWKCGLEKCCHARSTKSLTRSASGAASGMSPRRASKRAKVSSRTASRIPPFAPKWCCTAPHVTPARRAISLAVVRWKPTSAMLSTTASRMRRRVSAVRSACVRRRGALIAEPGRARSSARLSPPRVLDGVDARHQLRHERRAGQRDAALSRELERAGEVLLGDVHLRAEVVLHRLALAHGLGHLVGPEVRDHQLGELAVRPARLLQRLERKAHGARQRGRLEGGRPLQVCDQVDADLGLAAGAEQAGADHAVGGDRAQVGLDPREHARVAAGEELEHRVGGAHVAAHARVDDVHALLRRERCHRLHGRRQDRAVDHDHEARRGALEDAVLAGDDRAHLLVGLHADADHLARRRDLARRGGGLRAAGGELLHRGRRDVEDRRLDARGREPLRHRLADVSETDEARLHARSTSARPLARAQAITTYISDTMQITRAGGSGARARLWSVTSEGWDSPQLRARGSAGWVAGSPRARGPVPGDASSLLRAGSRSSRKYAQNALRPGSPDFW